MFHWNIDLFGYVVSQDKIFYASAYQNQESSMVEQFLSDWDETSKLNKGIHKITIHLTNRFQRFATNKNHVFSKEVMLLSD